MSPDICYLITLLYDDELLRVVLKIDSGKLREDTRLYPMEPESRAELQDLLPEHIRSFGPIVEVDEIFDVVIHE